MYVLLVRDLLVALPGKVGETASKANPAAGLGGSHARSWAALQRQARRRQGTENLEPEESVTPNHSEATTPLGRIKLVHKHQPRRRPSPASSTHVCALRPQTPIIAFSLQHAVGDASPSDIVILDPLDAAVDHPSHTRSRFALFGSPDTLARASRRDRHLHSTTATANTLFWPSCFDSLQRIVAGAIRCPVLPPVSFAMSLRRKAGVPATPRVISPSPTPSEQDAQEYAGPTTRSAARRRTTTPLPLEEHADEDEYDTPGLRRSRTRSRSPIDARKPPRMTAVKPKKSASAKAPDFAVETNGNVSTTNGHLAPPQPATPSGWSWRDFSRSPSPLGLIPIHRHWRTFVHKHEVPRKVLHVSIGFFVVWLYVNGTRTSSVPPFLMAALLPITASDWLRHRYASFNRFYVRVWGALMRESEFAGWNGVIFYLLGAWIALYAFPKDVGVMGVLLLSWCDTAASTIGRLWGRYTPRIRRGKSLAGSSAAFVVGVATSYFFYGWLVPKMGPLPGNEDFMFNGALSLPQAVTKAIGISRDQATITGPLALAVMSLWSGFVASASEVVDVFGWDDNLTIPVLSAVGIWGFLKIFT